MKTIRDHDKFYLDEDRKNTPKEYFKFLIKETGDFLSTKSSILDVGSATGDFLSYLTTLYPNAELTGMDVMDELLERSKKEVPTARHINANIFTGENLPSKGYDAVFMNGVHAIFDECEPWINNLITLLNPGGRVFVFGNFNPSNVDLIVKARHSTLDPEKPWQLGFNLWSKKTVGLILERKNLKYSFYDFHITIDLEKHDDPFRSWTFKAVDGSHIIVNGTQIIRNLSLLEIIPE